MYPKTTLLLCALVTLPVLAQQQQAGNAASTDTEGTFQALVDACDDVDALMLRARIRLQIPRTTEDAATEAQNLLQQGFETCASGDKEAAKIQLQKALEVAEAGAAEKFSVAENETASSNNESASNSVETTGEADNENAKPWWRFW